MKTLMTKEEFIDKRTKIISKMLDNPNEGIYPTTVCFNELDAIYDDLKSNYETLKQQKDALLELLKKTINLLKEVQKHTDSGYTCESFELNSRIVSIENDDFYHCTGYPRDLISIFFKENEKSIQKLNQAIEESKEK